MRHRAQRRLSSRTSVYQGRLWSYRAVRTEKAQRVTMNRVLCAIALCCLLAVGSVAQAGMQVFQYGNVVAVVLDEESNMNWLEIYLNSK